MPSVVALPTTVVALLLSERFSILDETSGRPRFSESDQLRINQIDEGFNRAIGVFAGKPIDPEGNLMSQDAFDSAKGEWLTDGADGDFIQSLMVPCYEPGKYAGWISPPKVGIDNKPGDFEYVKLHMA